MVNRQGEEGIEQGLGRERDGEWAGLDPNQLDQPNRSGWTKDILVFSQIQSNQFIFKNENSNKFLKIKYKYVSNSKFYKDFKYDFYFIY